jgi:hypothetical protein
MNKETSEAWDPGVRGALAEIIFYESNKIDVSTIQVLVLVLCPI